MLILAPLCFCLVLPITCTQILGIYMHRVSFTHTSRMIYVWSITEEQGMSRHEQECAFEKFADISNVLQPLPSAKMAWRSNFTITVFSASFCLPLAFAPLVLQGIDCSLLDSESTSSIFCLFFFHSIRLVVAVMHLLHSANPSIKQSDL